MRLLSLVLMLLSSCISSASVVPPAPVGFAKWPDVLKPVLVTVDPHLDANCQAAIEDSLLFWQAQGVTWLRGPVVVPTLEPRLGIIGFSPFMPGPEAAGETRTFTAGDQMASAFVALDPTYCVLGQTATHELGHALGLVHDERNEDSVMWPDTSGLYEVSPAQRAWVR